MTVVSIDVDNNGSNFLTTWTGDLDTGLHPVSRTCSFVFHTLLELTGAGLGLGWRPLLRDVKTQNPPVLIDPSKGPCELCYLRAWELTLMDWVLPSLLLMEPLLCPESWTVHMHNLWWWNSDNHYLQFLFLPRVLEACFRIQNQGN